MVELRIDKKFATKVVSQPLRVTIAIATPFRETERPGNKVRRSSQRLGNVDMTIQLVLDATRVL